MQIDRNQKKANELIEKLPKLKDNNNDFIPRKSKIENNMKIISNQFNIDYLLEECKNARNLMHQCRNERYDILDVFYAAEKVVENVKKILNKK